MQICDPMQSLSVVATDNNSNTLYNYGVSNVVSIIIFLHDMLRNNT